MTLVRRAITFALALCAHAALHAEARVCLSNGDLLSSTSVINCDSPAPTTLNSLALSGWKVVRALPVIVGSQQRVQLLLQREDKILASGFE